MNMLLIEDNRSKAAWISQAFKTSRLKCVTRRIDQCKAIMKFVSGMALYEATPAPDLTLFDFSEPDANSVKLLRGLLRATKKIDEPIVLFTSEKSEQLLKEICAIEKMREPHAATAFFPFVRRMRDLPTQRFLDSLSLVANLGTVVVRVPEQLLVNGGDEDSLISA